MEQSVEAVRDREGETGVGGLAATDPNESGFGWIRGVDTRMRNGGGTSLGESRERQETRRFGVAKDSGNDGKALKMRRKAKRVALRGLFRQVRRVRSPGEPRRSELATVQGQGGVDVANASILAEHG